MILTVISLLALFSAEITMVEAKNIHVLKDSLKRIFGFRRKGNSVASLGTEQGQTPRPFTFNEIRDYVIPVREIFHKDKSLVSTRYKGIKFIRDLKSGDIFAQASSKLHSDAKLGEGANGIVKRAFDINDESRMLAIKKPKKGYTLDMTREGKNLNPIGLQYKKIDTPITMKGTDKQYLIMNHVGGQNLGNYLANHKHSGAAIKSAIEKSINRLDKLHKLGFVHGDPHLKNFKIENSKVSMIDAGELSKKGETFDYKTDKMVLLSHFLDEIKFLLGRNKGLQIAEKSNPEFVKNLGEASATLRKLQFKLESDFNLLAKERNPGLDSAIAQRYGLEFLQGIQQRAIN